MKMIKLALGALLLVPACQKVDRDQRGDTTYKPVEDPNPPAAPATNPDTTTPSAGVGTAEPDPWKPDPWREPDTTDRSAETATPATPTEPEATNTNTDTDTDVVAGAQDQATGTTFTDASRSFSQRSRDRLDKLDAKLHELEARADARSRQLASDLRVRRDAIEKDLDHTSDKAKSTWHKFKARVDSSFHDIERDLDEALR